MAPRFLSPALPSPEGLGHSQGQGPRTRSRESLGLNREWVVRSSTSGIFPRNLHFHSDCYSSATKEPFLKIKSLTEQFMLKASYLKHQYFNILTKI